MRRAALVLALLAGITACGDVSEIVALRGTILTPESIIRDGLVVIEGGTIREITDQPKTIAGAVTIDTDGIIVPGLIDLHNHLLWSVFPRWTPADAFASRDVWMEAPAYREGYADVQSRLRRTHGCDVNQFGEIGAVAGGVTSILGSLRSPCAGGLVRNLDYEPGFRGFVDPPRTLIDVDRLSASGAERLARQLHESAGGAFFVHVGEGRADDPSARAEFSRLVEHGLLTARTVIVHGNGLGDAEFEMIRAAGASLVWSPRSNIELYGETTSIAMAIERGIPVALGADWSLTGSINLLDELRYASEWSRQNLGDMLDDRDLVRMVTSTPAEIAGFDDRIGAVRAGLAADLFVVRGDRANPYHSLVTAGADDVRLVMIDGGAVYGVAAVMNRLRSRFDLEQVDACGERMALDTTLGPASLLDRRSRWSATQERLHRALKELRPGLELRPLIECEPE